jgi:uncharacterized protein (DUF305 family)
MSKILIISLLIVTFILGTGFGYLVSPEYAKQSMMKTNSFGASDEKYDQRFLEAMIEHHEDAIMMAEDALEKSNRPEVRDLAEDIINAQTNEVEDMKEWINTWYK